MASSASRSQVKYDVFLSFRGEDTRNGFTSHLNAALCQKKIKTFIDDELRRGDEISPSLLKAIEGSKISIIIFSKGYASSTWCLKELVEILDCKKMYGQIVIPVFYGIDPSHVRKQEGTFEEAFAEHKARFREREEMLTRWRNALTEVANLSGFDSNAIRPESKLIETIIGHILKRLNDKYSSNNKNLVGVEMKIQKIIYLLFKEQNEVCKVGIWGMGGIGKTTLANAVFNEISHKFEASYFVPNVREASSKNQLQQLQKELLSTILGDGHLNIRLTFTKERLGHKRVLIVFDDVIDVKQIRELIGDLEYLSSDSRIIITTRDKQVLKNCGLDDSAIYEVEGLSCYESLQLFQQHAFKQNHPIDEVYMKLSNRVIGYTKGLPLALEVLGCFLLGRDKFEWESALDELKKSPNDVIQAVLKISYDGLGIKEKDLYLDIACFFKGWDKYLVGSFSSHIGICVLIDKALITTSYNTIKMHDLIQEMGWEIVRQEPVNKRCQRSRLWHHDDVYHVLKRNLGTDKIRGLQFDMFGMGEIHLNPHSFSEMDNLRFLIVEKSIYDCNKLYGFEGLEFDFTELRCLSWDDYPCTSLPLKFSLENLVVLKMHRSNLKQLWNGVKDLAHLKYIDLSNSEHLLNIPDLSKASNLESLILKGCTSLVEITPPSQNLNKLVNLNLSYCSSLINLPIGIQSQSLRDVILSYCSKLNTAPRISSNVERLCLDGTAIKELSSSIECPSRLVELTLKGCLKLESLPTNICNLKSLRQLNLSGLSNLNTVPEIPCNIKELHLDGTAIKELSSSIENVSNLVILNLRNCSSLKSLPNGICKLKSLKYLYVSGCSNLDRLPEDMGNLESLQLLEANGISVKELPSSMVHLKNLRDLSFESCKSQGMVSSLSPILSGLQFLMRLNLNHCSITELPIGLGKLSFLECLELAGNNFESIPTSIISLSNLWFLNIRFCDRLQSLPKLPCKIQNLEAEGCKLLKAVSGLTIPNFRCFAPILSFSNCFNLDGNAIRNILDDALLKNLSDITLWLEATKRRVSLPDGCICFPGSEIPEWFDIQSVGCFVELPRGWFNHRFLGYVFCIIVGGRGYRGHHSLHSGMEVQHDFHLGSYSEYCSTPYMKKIILNGFNYIESDHIFLGYNCDLVGKFTCNTKAFISFKCTSLAIKNCGVRLLFTQEFEEPQSKRLKSSIFFREESSSRENFEFGTSKVMSEVEEQLVSNNNDNGSNNNGGGAVHGSIVQQSHTGGGNKNRGIYRRGNRGRGNVQGKINRELAGPRRTRGPCAVRGRGMMGKGGNGSGQGIGEALPLMYPQSIGFNLRFGAPMGWMGSYGDFLGASTPPFSGGLSGCTIIDEEEARSAGLKFLNFFDGESRSREKFELGQRKVMYEVEEQVVSGNNNVNRGGVVQQTIVQQGDADGGCPKIFLGNAGGSGGNRGNWGRDNMQGGGYGRGNWGRVSVQGMGNRGPAVDRRGMMGNGGNGFGQGIGEAPPLMHTQSIASALGFGAPMGWMGSYGGFLGAPTPPFSAVLPRCSIIDEEKAYSKRLKSSNFCKGESSSRQLEVESSGIHLAVPHEKEVHEFHPRTNESNCFTLLDLDKFPPDFVRSHPFTRLDLEKFPQDSVGPPIIIISDSDEDNDG